MASLSDPSVPAGTPSAWIDGWIDAAHRPTDRTTLRQARVVISGSLMALVGLSVLAATLLGAGAPPVPVAQAVGAIGLILVALGLVRWGGHVQPAAWLMTLTLVSTPLLQAALDVGIHDPALGLVVLAPLAAALTSGGRLAAVNAVVAIGGVLALYLTHGSSHTQSGFTSTASLDAYTLACIAGGTITAALAGALYVRHTRDELAEADGQSTRLDAALRASETRYRSLFDHIPVGMYRTTTDGRILLANVALARMIGAESPEDARTFNAALFYDDPVDRDRFQEEIHREGAVRRFETRWRRVDGEIRYVRIGAHVARDAEGQPLYYEGTVEDVTSERQAREALYRSEARFRALVQRSSDVIVVVDREARLTYVSPSVERLLGHRPDRLLGSSIADLIHPEDRPEAEAFLEASHESGPAASQIEVRFRHVDGHFVFAEGAGTPLYNDAAVGGLVLNLRDVTERKRAQAVLLQAKRQAEEVAALKSTFLANMSHEIRTPLTAILGFADVLSEEIEDPDQQEFIDLIARSGRRLMDTLNSVLDLARLEASRDRLAQERVDVAALVDESVKMFQPAAGERGLRLTAEIEPDAVHAAILDEAAFARVLHNLIGNALKFTDHGRVTVHVDGEPDGPNGPEVVVRVSDTGIGIDEVFLPRVFGEFEQESSGVERTHEGAGLGLAISRQLVERMGGTIGVESRKGAGTTFTVRLRAAEAADPEGDLRPLVLIVDDNDQARDVAEHTLKEHYRVVLASDGDEALAAVESEHPDAVLLDIHLGQSITGEDIMRQLRQTPAFADLPIVAVTAYALPGDRARFLAAGFDAYVTKPYTRTHLIESMGEAMQSRLGAGDGAPAAAFIARKSGPPATPAPTPTVQPVGGP